MMKARELKKEAKESLKGNMGKAIGTYVVYFLASFAITFALAFIPIIGTLAASIIVYGVLYGCVVVLMKIKRNQEVSAFDCLKEGFPKCIKVLCCNFWIVIKLLPWVLLYVIAVILSSISPFTTGVLAIVGAVLLIVSLVMIIIRSLRYSLVNYVLFDNQEMTSKEIVNKSKELMENNCGRLFGLGFSFIGWIILTYVIMFVFAMMGIIGMIIGYIVILLIMLYLVPYTQMTFVCFYEELINKDIVVENNEPISL